LNLNLFIHPTTLTNQPTQKLQLTLPQNKLSKQFHIKYLHPLKDTIPLTLNPPIHTFNKQHPKFTHFPYLNPNNHSLTSLTLTPQLTSPYKQNPNNPTLKLYKHIPSHQLPQTLYPNLHHPNKFQD
ncbi:fibrinogen-binding adhesin SdrG C-terminal domain-containing protein, partial [Staphylococcus aureus]|uniref:fibrinogen-binding adhesin SdrG C-terminal domain-containing protein n=1 Tax=Staphylococcus aureus TaxID=1280 RepID=UPI001642DCEC